jgi:hypothetical protein
MRTAGRVFTDARQRREQCRAVDTSTLAHRCRREWGRPSHCNWPNSAITKESGLGRAAQPPTQCKCFNHSAVALSSRPGFPYGFRTDDFLGTLGEVLGPRFQRGKVLVGGTGFEPVTPAV